MYVGLNVKLTAAPLPPAWARVQFIFHEFTDCLLDQYGLLKLTDEQFQQVDSSYFLKTRKETYGWDVLTNQRQFYLENYPDIIVEKNNFDTLFSMMLRGE